MKKVLQAVIQFPKLREKCLRFLESNQKHGILLLKETLDAHLSRLHVLKSVLREHPNIRKEADLKHYVTQHKLSTTLDNSLQLDEEKS